MRTIKFRGKRVDNNEWVYGNYVLDPQGKHRIYYQPFVDATSNTYHFVHPETVGQFIGLQDCNKIDIYEGDFIVSHRDFAMTSPNNPVVVEWSDRIVNCGCCSVIIATGFDIGYEVERVKVVGNIHENKGVINE